MNINPYICRLKNVTVFDEDGKETKTLSNYDGDSIKALVDYGQNIQRDKVRIRLVGIDTPEVNKKTHSAAGKAVRDYLAKEINEDPKHVYLFTEKDKTGMYGRLLGTLYIGGKDMNRILLASGMAKPIVGTKRPKWTSSELKKARVAAEAAIEAIDRIKIQDHE